MKTTQLQQIEYDQDRWNTFKNQIMSHIIRDKDEHKGKPLDNGLAITGIGEKSLKVENNFYSWEDIEISATEGTKDKVMQSIINYLFEDKPYSVQEYEARKWEITTPITEIKEEIIAHKEHYKTGPITGIGEKTVKYGRDYDACYVSWEDLQKKLDEFQDGYTAYEVSGTADFEIIKQWYNIGNLQFLNKEEQKVFKQTPEYISLFRLYEQGKLSYVDIQNTFKTPEKIAEALEVIIREWNDNNPIPFEYSKNKPTEEIYHGSMLTPDDLYTPVLHRADELKNYTVAHIPKQKRETYTVSRVSKHGITLMKKPSFIHLEYDPQKYNGETLRKIVADLGEIAWDEDDWGWIDCYDENNDKKLDLRVFDEILNQYRIYHLMGERK